MYELHLVKVHVIFMSMGHARMTHLVKVGIDLIVDQLQEHAQSSGASLDETRLAVDELRRTLEAVYRDATGGLHSKRLREGRVMYDVRLDDALSKMSRDELQRVKQLAYVVDVDTLDILVGVSGHGKLTRGRSKHGLEGGWIFPTQDKLTFYSGTLGNVSDKSGVSVALSNALHMYFRES